jgi:hypothetical protein
MITTLLLFERRGRCYNPLPSLERRGDGIILSPLSKDEEMITTLLLFERRGRCYNPLSSLER